LKNRNSRKDQENGTHTAGTRHFAVVHRNLEEKLGRPIGRVELYFQTHINHDGQPVNAYASSKMVGFSNILKFYFDHNIIPKVIVPKGFIGLIIVYVFLFL
jgi:hypothetical protein